MAQNVHYWISDSKNDWNSVFDFMADVRRHPGNI